MVKKVKVTKTKTSTPTKDGKLNASQKIEALEGQILKLEKVIDTQTKILADEIDNVRETTNDLRQIIRALTQRINASIKAAEEGEVSNSKVHEIIVNENVKELKNKVDLLVNYGVLQKADDAVVDNKTFIVAQEIQGDKVINPRIQFYTESLSEAERAPFIGKKLGDKIAFEGTDFLTEIIELYTFIVPNVDQKFENESESEEEKASQEGDKK